MRTQKQDLESLQVNVKTIELKLENLINQVSYQKAFLDKKIAAAVKDKLMIKFDGVKEIKNFINSIPLQDLLRLIIKRLDLKIVEVPASTGGYELKPVVEEMASPKDTNRMNPKKENLEFKTYEENSQAIKPKQWPKRRMINDMG